MADGPASVTEEAEEDQLTSSVTDEAAPPPQVTKSVTRAADPAAVLGGAHVTMPEVQAHAIAAAREDAAQQQAAQPSEPLKREKGKTDADGRAFDPALHVSPTKLNRQGYLEKKRGGAAQALQRNGGAAPTKPVAPQSKANFEKSAGAAPANSAQVDMDARIESTANVSATMVFVLAQALGGDEFKPDDNDGASMRDAFANYYRVRGVVDMPPEAMLAVALGGYVAKRWNAPKFSVKRAGWWQWIKSSTAKPVPQAYKSDDGGKAVVERK